jgi:cell wall assembly regulator SMI1
MGEWDHLLGPTSGFRLALGTPCSESELRTAEAELGLGLPASLRSFFQYTDGFTDLDSQYPYAWNLASVVAENLKHWASESMCLDRRWLGVGGDGVGNWFCLDLHDDADPPVVHWGWIGSEATEVADGLASFWPAWLSGRISV